MRSVVTGGGGFLGSRIAELLLEAGDTVTVLGRSRYPKWRGTAVRSLAVDVRDRKAVSSALAGADRVFHAAAKVGIWGPYREFHETNVVGTRHVIDGCLENGIAKLIFTSSPSITFAGEPQRRVDENCPTPARWLSPYPETKSEAERLVREANSARLATVSLRPHLVWGAGDPSLLPRVIERARKGKLVRVGDGTNLVDLTHVDDAARAHLQAAERLEIGGALAGKAYFLSSGEPVRLWDFINEVLDRAYVARPRRRLSFAAAYRLGAVLEKLPLRKEPPMTRFLAHQLAQDHYYDISAAKRDFGYSPEMSVKRGLDDYFAGFERR